MNYNEHKPEENKPEGIKPERKIYRSDFTPQVADGDVKFLVLESWFDEIDTKNGIKEIVKVKLDLEGQGQTEVKTFTLFVDYKPNGRFYQFAMAAMAGLGIDYFAPDKIIGCRGEGVLSHYKSKTNDFTYPQLSNWVFYQTNEKIGKALSQYISEDGSDFELADEDLDF